MYAFEKRRRNAFFFIFILRTLLECFDFHIIDYCL